MRKTAAPKTDHPLAVDLKGLQAMLSCGIPTAKRIADRAGARIEIGRRVLYSVDRIEQYLSRVAC